MSKQTNGPVSCYVAVRAPLCPQDSLRHIVLPIFIGSIDFCVRSSHAAPAAQTGLPPASAFLNYGLTCPAGVGLRKCLFNSRQFCIVGFAKVS